MNAVFRLIVVATIFCCSSELAPAQRAAYLVRHAEKLQNEDPDAPLSEQGLRQAEVLALLLKDAEITNIYTTQFTRTKQTSSKLQALLTKAKREVSVQELR